MAHFIPDAVMAVLVVVLIVRMIFAGFVTKSGIFAWPMFSEMSMASFHMRDGANALGPISQWEHLIDGDIGMTEHGVEEYLKYLRRSGKVPVGTVTMYTSAGIVDTPISDWNHNGNMAL